MAALVSSVDIANMALAHVGSRSHIESFSERSEEARVCRLWYEPSRVTCLESHNWNFARKRQLLTLDSDPAPTGVWTYRYQYPSDCIKARELINPYNPYQWQQTPSYMDPDAVPFEIELDSSGERRTLVTNLKQATLLYTADISNTALFTHYFVMALSYALANRIAYSLTHKSSIAEETMSQFLMWRDQAAKLDANEHIPRAPREAEAIRGRY